MNAYQRGQELLCGGYSSYTPTGKSYFAKAGRYGKVPHEGDIIYFYTSSLGRISHVGIVAAVQLRNGLYHLDAIEGNTAAGIQFERDGGSVALKHYEFLPAQVGAPNRIDGFGTPAFAQRRAARSSYWLLHAARSAMSRRQATGILMSPAQIPERRTTRSTAPGTDSTLRSGVRCS